MMDTWPWGNFTYQLLHVELCWLSRNVSFSKDEGLRLPLTYVVSNSPTSSTLLVEHSNWAEASGSFFLCFLWGFL